MASPQANESVGNAPTKVEDPKLDSPLQAYMLSWQELATVSHARQTLVSQCMSRFAFDYPVEAFSAFLEQIRASEQEGNSRVFGITDAATAATYGYDLPSPSPQVGKPTSTHDSPAYNFVLWGTKKFGDLASRGTESPGSIDGEPIPGGGCTGEADRELGLTADVSTYGMARDILIENSSVLVSNNKYRSIVEEWVACMSQSGYRVTDPLNDAGDIRAARATRTASGDDEGVAPPKEIQLALADINCKVELEFVQRIGKVANKIDNTSIAENQLLLEADRKRLDAQVKKAAKLIGEQSG